MEHHLTLTQKKQKKKQRTLWRLEVMHKYQINPTRSLTEYYELRTILWTKDNQRSRTRTKTYQKPQGTSTRNTSEFSDTSTRNTRELSDNIELHYKDKRG